MISEAQEKLARQIAAAGIWKYSATVELIEKKSPSVAHMKAAMEGGPSNILPSWEEMAYLNGRLAEEIGAATYARAYIFYMRRGTDVAKSVGDVAAKIAAKRVEKPEITVEWIQAQHERWMSEQSTYLEARRLKCMEA